ncbi:MAG: cytidine deaminase [Thermoplasmata archaeon]
MRKDYMQMIEFARHASFMAYAPYSKFRVGAAVLTEGGRIFTGCNVENASYGLSLCAERVALTKAVSEGAKEILAIAVVAENGNASPCGACRQFIREFGENIDVVFLRGEKVIVKKISDLLPDAFTSADF